ncbi:T9SS type A sorting domain-containing protein [Spirosoma taeanense]|uniref:T9SS type A sorting domain-containing protein n=1 Tax=Spirosoma taeanense TaxID=2735870 RepID=A0A6M5Y9Z1_9BACT|nr:T9SS type A sorting domain-containing protein [Spirosoma taeanense]QJW90785.1 T9SS type A sorting domain-containing protein [Spirosoma taeanense]
MTNIFTNRYWLIVLLVLNCSVITSAQTTLTLYYGDPNDSPDLAFDGNVFQAGNQFGDAPIFAKFGGTGTRSFQIDSPGENKTITVDKDGFFFIRPIESTVIDESKIKNFSGTVYGSVVITVKPLSITTISAIVATDVPPSSEITVSYRTGAGTFPVDLAINSFKVQLLSASGAFVTDLLNSSDQYSGREQKGSSYGGTRYIKATLPSTISPGSYRVRVITQGLITNILGSASSLFTVKANNPTITAGNINTGKYCAGSTVVFPFSTTGTFPAGNVFKVQLVNPNGTTLQDLPGTSSTSPISATLPSTLTSGAYRFRIASTATNVESQTDTINVLALATMSLSGSSTITAGTTAPVVVALTGTPPWSFTYTDYNTAYSPNYIRTVTSSLSPITIRPTFFSSTTYDKAFILGFRDSNCGTSAIINGAAQITINQLTITTGTLSGTYCPGSVINVPFTVSGPLPAGSVSQLQLSDRNGNFQNAQIIGVSAGTSPIGATIPQMQEVGTGYKLRVTLQESTIPGSIDYSNSVNSIPSPLIISRPDAPKVLDISFCSGSTTGPLSATGVNLKWYIEGIGKPLASAPTPPNNRSSLYYVSQTINNCESALSAINVTQKALPSAPVVSSLSVCQGTQGQFSTSTPNALWYTTATGGLGSSQPPVINSQIAGEQIAYVSQTVNGCESPRATVKAIIHPIPFAPTVQTPSPVCQFAVATALTATGSNLTWYTQSGRLAGSPVPNTALSGILSYSVSQTVNNCESPRATITQVVQPAPALPVAGSVRYCVGDVPRSLTASGSNLKWYSTQIGGTGSTVSPAFFTDIANVLTFYVTQTDNNNCESLRQPVSVSIVAPPSAPLVTSNQVVCQFAKVGALTASPGSGLLWQGPGINGNSEIAPTPVTTQPGTFVYSVTQKAGSCTSTPSSITLIVRKTPDAPKVISPVTFCIGQGNTPLTAIAEGQLTWYTNADHSGSPFVQVVANTERAGVSTYYVTQTDEYKCESANSSLEVRVAAKASARLTGDGDVNPGDSTAIRVRLTGDGPWTFNNWNGKLINTSDSLYVEWIHPRTSGSYSITNLRSACGVGNILNNYTLIVRTPLAVEPLEEPSRLNVYPNPTTGDISVDWSAPTRQTVDLQLINAEGKVIRQITRQATGQPQTELLRIGNQPDGTYYLRLSTPKNGVVAQKIVKE